MAVDATFAVEDGPEGLEAALERLGAERPPTSRSGAGILVVSDVGSDIERCRIPILLAVGAVHQRLVAEGVRTRTSIVAETDEARTTHDAATLLGYGADAIVPRLVLETIAHLADEDRIGGDNPTASEAQRRYRTAMEDGVRKIMSKMGISVLDSYRSAQIFEALGLSPAVIDRCFTGTTSVLGGHEFVDLARTVLEQHAIAYAGDTSVDARDRAPEPRHHQVAQGRRVPRHVQAGHRCAARRARSRTDRVDGTVRARRCRQGGRRRSDRGARAPRGGGGSHRPLPRLQRDGPSASSRPSRATSCGSTRPSRPSRCRRSSRSRRSPRASPPVRCRTVRSRVRRTRRSQRR
jgi:hypothetical protein